MALITTNMGLKVWNLLSDLFSHTDLQSNWNALDAHDHTAGKGVQVPTGGLANQAVTAAKIANNTITAAQVANGTLTTTQLASNAGITPSQLAASARPLVPTSTNTSMTAQAGQMVFTTNGTTISLPDAVANAGASVGVLMNASVSPGDPFVTVAAQTSPQQFIFQRGFGSGLASWRLGSSFAYVVLQAFGGGWYVVSGDFDTGWLPITSFGPNAQSGAGLGYLAPAARRRGDTVYLRGVVQATAVLSSGATLFTVPSSLLFPPAVVLLPVSYVNSTGNGSQMSTGGVLTISTSMTATGALGLDGLSYAAVIS